MTYHLTITGVSPPSGDVVLKQETALAGTALTDAAVSLIRRSIENIASIRHEPLGALAEYSFLVPSEIANSTPLFETTNRVVAICENDILANYIFYLPRVTIVAGTRPCIPLNNTGLAITSYIDELKFLSEWVVAGFPLKIGIRNGVLAAVDIDTTMQYPNETTCNGCTAGTYPTPPRRPYYPRTVLNNPPVLPVPCPPH